MGFVLNLNLICSNVKLEFFPNLIVWYKLGFMVLAKTHGMDIPYGIDNTHGIDLNSWYSIGTSESHTYERAECYPYAGFFSF